MLPPVADTATTRVDGAAGQAASTEAGSATTVSPAARIDSATVSAAYRDEPIPSSSTRSTP